MKNKTENKQTGTRIQKRAALNIFIAVAVFCVCFSFSFSSCKEKYVPRPYGYFRVYLPKHSYKTLDTLNLPYTFALSEMAEIESKSGKNEKYWIDINYPDLNAKIHGSYKDINNNLLELSEDSRRFVYAHSGQADGITEQVFVNPENSVYGILYELKGNVASPVQFVLTDSTNNLFRGALYFNNKPNKDSIAPMLDYVKEDIVRLMESFEWRK